MKKVIKVGNQDVQFKVSGDIGRLYRLFFKRDFLADVAKLKKSMVDENDELIPEKIDIETFENIAWSMAKHADPHIPDIDEWLEQFEYGDIINSFKEIFILLGESMQSVVESKNNLARVTN